MTIDNSFRSRRAFFALIIKKVVRFMPISSTISSGFRLLAHSVLQPAGLRLFSHLAAAPAGAGGVDDLGIPQDRPPRRPEPDTLYRLAVLCGGIERPGHADVKECRRMSFLPDGNAPIGRRTSIIVNCQLSIFLRNGTKYQGTGSLSGALLLYFSSSQVRSLMM